MSPDVILAVLIAVPVLAFVLLRVNGALIFLSTCLGAVLLQYVGPESDNFFNFFLPNLSENNVKLGLVLLPVILTMLFMIKTVKGGRLVLSIFPSVGAALLLALLIVPLLPPGVTHNVMKTETWQQINNLQAMIVGISALLCLFFLWLQRPKRHKEEKHGKHGKKH